MNIIDGWKEQGMKQGMKQGMQQGMEKVAINLLHEGADTARVSRVTELSETRVQEIKNNL